MQRTEEIQGRIGELENELANVEGTKTEIYTRIVGYYRSLKNWNRGKREEYDHRVTFRSASAGTPGANMPEPMVSVLAAPEASAAEPSPDTAQSAIQSYAYFFRQTCPNCPPVRTYVENLALDGQMVDVDTGEGMAQAVEHQILSTPTVILMDKNGDPVAQAGSVDQLRSILESAG
jgi:anaerobic ribonucleoside-triphosphate reductase-like protein